MPLDDARGTLSIVEGWPPETPTRRGGRPTTKFTKHTRAILVILVRLVVPIGSSLACNAFRRTEIARTHRAGVDDDLLDHDPPGPAAHTFRTW